MQSAQRQSCSQTGSDSGPPALRSIATAAGLSSLVRACVSCLASGLEVGPDALSWRTAVRGKPALAGRFADSDLRFNLSHCDESPVYALSYGREVGIDVEAVR